MRNLEIIGMEIIPPSTLTKVFGGFELLFPYLISLIVEQGNGGLEYCPELFVCSFTVKVVHFCVEKHGLSGLKFIIGMTGKSFKITEAMNSLAEGKIGHF